MAELTGTAFATSRTRLEAVVATAVDGVILIDGNGLIQVYNPACEKLFGYSRDEVLGRNVRMLMPEPYHSEHDNYLESYRRTGNAKIIGIGREVTGRRKDGTEFPMELSVGEADDGDDRAFVGIIRDITERKRAEKAIRSSESTLRAVIETAADGVIIINGQGDVELFNPACERLFGYAPDEVVGQNVKMLMPEPYRGEHDHYLSAYRTTGVPKIIGIGREVTGRRKDGTEFPMELSVGEAQTGDTVVFVGIVRDITERKHAERRLAESVREMEAFAYSVAHDLKAPLRAINGFSDALVEDYADTLDDTGREYLEYVAGSALRMGHLIDDLLQYSRLGRGGLQFRRVDMANVVEHLRGALLQEIEDRNAEIEIEGELPEMEGNEEILTLVMQNLVANAIKFVPEGVTPKVILRGMTAGGLCMVEVVDNGIGMKPEMVSRIFDIFQRLHSTEEYPGTGIGLAMVKKGVQLHGGDIEVDTAVGTGTTFRLTFPRVQRKSKNTGGENDRKE